MQVVYTVEMCVLFNVGFSPKLYIDAFHCLLAMAIVQLMLMFVTTTC